MDEYFWSVLEADLTDIPNFIKNGFGYVLEIVNDKITTEILSKHNCVTNFYFQFY